MRYLVNGLTASRVNLIQNDYAAGIPSPLAFLGLASAISNAVGFGYYDAKILPILSRVTPSIGRTRPEFHYKATAFRPDEIMEDLHGQVDFGFLIDLPGLVDVEDIAGALVGRSLAGGVIFNRKHGERIRVRQVSGDGEGLRFSQRGRALVPGLREDMIGRVCFGSEAEILNMREILSVRPSEDNPTPGLRVPVAIGYRLLTQPGENPIPACARDDSTPHVFAEPGAGVAEFVSVRSKALTELDKDELDDRLWSWSVAGRHITAHPTYNPELNKD